ncbi:MAG: tRNA(Ile2) 2-agmatinylcytidine synthetase, partial [Halobaculum sp.]
GRVGECTDRRAYRLEGVVIDQPTTREGGHVFTTVAPPEAVTAGVESERSGDDSGAIADGEAVPAPRVGDAPRLDCAAFEPTKRFRDRVRALRVGDRVTVCGEVSDGTCKLEKFAVRGLVRAEPTTPDCPACGRSMGSAGRGQGYRCRECGTHAARKPWESVERALERGWYEVPPVARRHVAKPLVRGGFDAPTHPER